MPNEKSGEARKRAPRQPVKTAPVRRRAGQISTPVPETAEETKITRELARAEERRKVPRLTFNPRVIGILRGRYIVDEEKPALADLAILLADETGHPADRCLNYLKNVSAAERWFERRRDWWEKAKNEAENSVTANVDPIKSFQQKMLMHGTEMIDQAVGSLAILQPKDVTEVVMLFKMGQEAAYRALDLPDRIVRAALAGNGNAVPEPSVAQRYQNMSEEDYATAANANLSQLSPEVGSSPAPSRGDGGRPGKESHAPTPG